VDELPRSLGDFGYGVIGDCERVFVVSESSWKHHTAVGVGAGLDGGGGISRCSSFLFLPFGAGSKGGVLLYVTVLVTTDRTLTGRLQPVRGASKKYLLPDPSRPQSAGENGDRALIRPLLDDVAVPGEYAGDCGIFRRCNPLGDRADCGRLYGEGGGMDTEGDL